MNFLTYPARPRNGGPLEEAFKAGMYPESELDQWSWEPKLNGWRALVHAPTRTMWNRQGQKLSIAKDFRAPLEILAKTPFTWVDVEALDRRGNYKGALVVLDIILDGVTYRERRKAIVEFLPRPDLPLTCTYGVALRAPKHAIILSFYQQMPKANEELGIRLYEGLVAKRLDSLYPIQCDDPNRECPDWVKHRFTNC